MRREKFFEHGLEGKKLKTSKNKKDLKGLYNNRIIF